MTGLEFGKWEVFGGGYRILEGEVGEDYKYRSLGHMSQVLGLHMPCVGFFAWSNSPNDHT